MPTKSNYSFSSYGPFSIKARLFFHLDPYLRTGLLDCNETWHEFLNISKEMMHIKC